MRIIFITTLIIVCHSLNTYAQSIEQLILNDFIKEQVDTKKLYAKFRFNFKTENELTAPFENETICIPDSIFDKKQFETVVNSENQKTLSLDKSYISKSKKCPELKVYQNNFIGGFNICKIQVIRDKYKITEYYYIYQKEKRIYECSQKIVI